MRWLLLAILLMPVAAATPHAALAIGAPGHNEPSAWYGHAALVLWSDDQAPTYYTYRLSWPDDAPRAVASALGEAQFHLEALPFAEAVEDYRQQGRELRLLPLPVPPERIQSTREALQHEAEQDPAHWPAYHPIEDNCSTRIRDHIDALTGGALRAATALPGQAPRDGLQGYMAHDPTMSLTLQWLLGPTIDGAATGWDAMFLPLNLEREVQGLYPEAEAWIALEATGTIHEPISIDAWFAIPITLGALAAITGLLAPGTWRRVGLGAASAAAGLLLALPAALLTIPLLGDMGPYWADNANLLLASPLCLFLIPFGLWAMASRRGLHRLTPVVTLQGIAAILAVVLWILPLSPQDNGMFVLALAPLQLGLAIGVHGTHRHLATADAEANVVEG